MQKTRVILMIILIYSILVFIQSPCLRAEIRCRVEGTVTDKDTGVPIGGAEVRLVIDTGMSEYDWKTSADNNGYFQHFITIHYISSGKEDV